MSSLGVRALFRPLPTLPWRMAAATYVLVEATLGAIAFSSDVARPPVEIAAFVLALPALVATILVLYVVGAWAWDVRDGLAGQPMWPVTVTFTLLFAATAILNVMLVWLVWSTRRRLRRDELPRSRVSPRLR